MLRLFPILIFLIIFGIEPYQSESDANALYEIPQLSARAVGMGMAMTAVSGDEQCIFYNPAGLAGIKLFRIGQSHSLRHFPGQIKNLDQLDSDPVAIVHPLPFGGVFANGFVLQGECGYDYLNRNETDYPERKVWGIERYDAYAANVTPWTKIGFAHRSNLYRCIDNSTNKQASSPSPSPHTWRGGVGGEACNFTWQKEGEGGCFGFVQTILPGVNFGYTSEKMDEDYIPKAGVTTKIVRTGWSVKPLPWIHVAFDNVKIKEKYRLYEFNDQVFENIRKKKNWGVELTIIPGVVYRFGNIDGKKSQGVTLGFWRLKLNYGEAKDMMPLIVGDDYPDRFKDLHLAGWSVEF